MLRYFANAVKIAERVGLKAKPLYAYKATRLQTDPGAGNYAFLPLTQLPLQSVGGAGIGFYKDWGRMEPQLYYGQERVIDGLEGIEAPGIQSESLIDMDAYISELSGMQAETTEGG